MNLNEEFPEHFKLQQVQNDCILLTKFMTWLNEKKLSICLLDSGNSQFYRVEEAYPNEIISDFLEIDLEKIDLEKEKMIKKLEEMGESDDL